MTATEEGSGGAGERRTEQPIDIGPFAKALMFATLLSGGNTTDTIKRLEAQVASLEGRGDDAAAAAGADAAPGDGAARDRPEPPDERLARVERYYEGVRPALIAVIDQVLGGETTNPDFTYGFTPPALIKRLLDKAGLGPDDVFYDMGSGVGQAVLTAACVCRKAQGVEKMPRLFGSAEEARRSLGFANASFVQGDLRDADVSDGTILFSYSTCFTTPLLEALAAKAAEMAPGARVISTRDPLDHALLRLVSSEEHTWSTGYDGRSMRETYHFHERVAAPAAE